MEGVSDDGEVSYGLLLPFDSDDPEFARGVEAGILWHRLDSGEFPVRATVSARNAEMVMRIAEAKGLPFSAEPLTGEWLSVCIGTAPDA
jgi:hypothetical protein